ncbi:MAG: PQQ-binding-like beta-propeller repeat protein [Vulcanimicrobiota bacterium]
MKKFLFLLVLLAMAVGGAWIYFKRIHPGRPTSSATALPSLPKPAHEFRFGVLGRPSELPLHALGRMPVVQDLPLKFITCSSPAERWLMLTSGQVDAVVASTDELALVLPRSEAELNCFPLAQQNGNEQVVASKDASAPPWVAFLPGGVGQSLALDLKDPQLKLLSLQSPEKATAMLKAGQIRACTLWNPYLDQARAQGFEAKGQPSSSLEVWVGSSAGVQTGRLAEDDQARVVRAWFDLMRQLAEEPELTQRAISEETDLPAAQVPLTLKGLQFYSLDGILSNRAKLSEDLSNQMRDKVNLLSLAGQPVGGDIERLQVGLDWLLTLGAEGDPPTAPVETSTPEPLPEETPAPATPHPPGGDPFDRPGGSSGVATTQAGGDAAHSGRLPGPATLSEPKELWSSPLGAEPTSPVVASPDGSQLFVGLANGNLACLDRATGHKLWDYSLGERIRSAPACHGDFVEAASDSGQVASIKRSDGTKHWQVQVSSDVVGPLTEDDGALLLATYDGTVSALELADGETRWSQDTGANITAGLAVAEETVVACCLDHKIRSYNKKDGKAGWEVELGDACRATPCVESGLITVPCGDKKVYGLRYSDGTEAWQRALPDEVVGAPVALGRNVWVGCKDNYLHCLDRASGKEVYSYPTRERITNDLVGCGDTVYAVSQDRRLYAVSASNAKLRFKHKESQWLQTPWVQDATVYLPVADGYLKALK